MQANQYSIMYENDNYSSAKNSLICNIQSVENKNLKGPSVSLPCAMKTIGAINIVNFLDCN